MWAAAQGSDSAAQALTGNVVSVDLEPATSNVLYNGLQMAGENPLFGQ